MDAKDGSKRMDEGVIRKGRGRRNRMSETVAM